MKMWNVEKMWIERQLVGWVPLRGIQLVQFSECQVLAGGYFGVINTSVTGRGGPKSQV